MKLTVLGGEPAAIADGAAVLPAPTLAGTPPRRLKLWDLEEK